MQGSVSLSKAPSVCGCIQAVDRPISSTFISCVHSGQSFVKFVIIIRRCEDVTALASSFGFQGSEALIAIFWVTTWTSTLDMFGFPLKEGSNICHSLFLKKLVNI